MCFVRGEKDYAESAEDAEGAEKKRMKSGNFVTLDRKSPPLQTKGGAPSSSFDTWYNFDRRTQARVPVPPRLSDYYLLITDYFLLIFLVDVEDGAVFVEGYVEGFGFFYENVGELIFLGQQYGLELHHFEDGQEGYDHGVAGGAGFEELDEADGGGVARKDLAAELGDHLGYGEDVVGQFDADYFFFALEDLLEDADQVDEGDD